MKGWWISWYHHPADGSFELNTPWWISGYAFSPDRDVIVAAVQAESEEDAWEVVRTAYDIRPVDIEERFCDELTETLPWTHEGGRFQLADWMQWPDLGLPISEQPTMKE